MRASVYRRFGPPDVLRVEDVAPPPLRRGHTRVRVAACALNPKDVLVRKGRLTWLVGRRFPRIPGYDFAGELLTAAGDLPAGTPVFGMVGSQQGRACAEEVVVRVHEVARRPPGLTVVEAASVPLAGLTALQGLRDRLRLRGGQTVVINGASGGVGTLAVQLARLLGAHVIAVCSYRNVDRVAALGAHEVVDYTATDPCGLRGVHAFFDVYGSAPWERARATLRPGGRYCTTVIRAAHVARDLLARARLHRAAFVQVASRRDDLERLAGWLADGRLRPVLDRVVPLADAADAHAYLETRRARGKVVVQM